jgi:phosphoribosyl-ATP pyrophosphohydrolase/phosphoribosyl-AMP cyclohydrolase
MTDRTLRAASDLDALDFDRGGGLVAVVAQDAASGRTLMLAHANREALDRTLETGQMHFWSRSRRALWRKGETSGNTLAVRSLHADCDGDAVLALVAPTGPACHTGGRSCFGTGAAPAEGPGAETALAEGPGAVRAPAQGPGSESAAAEAGRAASVLLRLDETLAARAAERPGGSYTVRLLDDVNLRVKKLGEEGAELVAALAAHDGDRIAEEAADLVYHVLVALRAEGLGLPDLAAVLRARADGL